MKIRKKLLPGRVNEILITEALIFLLFGFTLKSYCQSNPSNTNLAPNLALPTPDVAKMEEFGTYPVNYFTGLVNIDVPIYDIKVGRISIPIHLKYHSSGVKVTERSGWVGLGWTLEPGGVISRKVMGLADEVPGGYLNSKTIHDVINTDSTDDLMYLNEIVRGTKDVEPDIYSYSFGGYSGKFLFNQADDYSVVYIPYSPVKIIKTNSENNLTFETLDPYGINYKFNEVFETSEGSNDNRTVRSAWKVSKIISYDKQDTIQFSYSSSYGKTYYDTVDKITVSDLVDNPNCAQGYFTSDQGVKTTSYPTTYSLVQYLTKIIFPHGECIFYLGEREDGWTDTSQGTQKRLDSIAILKYNYVDGSYQLKKKVRFWYSYFISTDGSGTKRLKLDSLHIVDSDDNIKRYSFEYNNSVILPKYVSFGRDYWGYYNGLNYSTSLIPRMTIPWQSSYNSQSTTITIGSNYMNSRDPNPSYNQACVLKKIHYPTGGYTEFDYETNRYMEDSVSKYAGGLRIKQIRSYSHQGATPVKKTFKYGENESGYGRKNFCLNNYFFMTEVTNRAINVCNTCPHEHYNAYKRQRTYTSVPMISIEPYDGSPVVYPVVTVYNGDENINNGKTIYHFSDYPDAYYLEYGFPIVESNHYKRGLKTLEKTIRTDDNTMVHNTSGNYGAYPDSTKANIGLKVKKIQINVPGDYPLETGDACEPDGDKYSYQYIYYRVKTGDNKLISSVDTSYSTTTPVQSISESVTYEYGNYLHQQVTKKTSIGSKGESVVKQIYYPHDVNGQVYDDMIQRNIIALPIREIKKIDGDTLETIMRNYINPYNNIYVPGSIYRIYNDNDSILEVHFEDYDDKGNPLQYSLRDGTVMSFLWGYNQTLPVAIIRNAEYNVVAGCLTATELDSIHAGYYNDEEQRAVLNKLRSCENLKGAMVTTYTYDPLAGITSQTDPNGRSTYYEYDSFGRLITIRDQDGKILKSYTYHYKDQ